MDQDEDMEVAAGFEQHRPRLRALAERLLGSGADAEDAVQDSWLRLRRVEATEIDNLGGWLTTVTSRICLDRLRARYARPETLDVPDLDLAGPDDPATDAVVADSVGRAVAVVLDSLSPAERVAFVLHDVFAVPFDEIASVLGRSTDATRKLAGRARRRAQLGAADDQPDLAGRREVIARFLDALREGDVSAMLALLAPDATRHVDPVLLAPGRPSTVHGARAIAEEARRFAAAARRARPATVDGHPGAAVLHHGVPTLVLAFGFAGDRIDVLEIIAAPERLRLLTVDAAA
ncbi:MAG: Putative RNA polymerase sigma factor [uncultured Actinomycetospora sp.]|uniref:RNA polymerase sigma factor n=1 Tax=uncultured Actinomycetospora sp. TaxID=1135996 RepID=A0A6J4HLR7_9PSEU|nr:MAG: Putative RNA polymerase sigma factor [uncultured Actinomycetospora sp.]